MINFSKDESTSGHSFVLVDLRFSKNPQLNSLFAQFLLTYHKISIENKITTLILENKYHVGHYIHFIRCEWVKMFKCKIESIYNMFNFFDNHLRKWSDLKIFINKSIS